MEKKVEEEPLLSLMRELLCMLQELFPGGNIKLFAAVEQIGENTALAHIIRMVQEAQGSKAPVQRIVDKAALIFVPAVAAIALITFIIWWLIGGNAALPQAILSAVAVLVIACPCAMGLATPTALMVGIGKAAQKQILIKDASALENLHKINALVIDKTGTLTIPNQNIDFTKQEDLDLETRETLKPHAQEAMKLLQERGIEVYMMIGEQVETSATLPEKEKKPITNQWLDCTFENNWIEENIELADKYLSIVCLTHDTYDDDGKPIVKHFTYVHDFCPISWNVLVESGAKYMVIEKPNTQSSIE